MKHVLRVALIALVLVLTLLPTLSVSAASDPTIESSQAPLPTVQGETSPYGVYVGGVAVTEENKDDIFGDVTIGEDGKEIGTARAVYDDKDRELTLSGTVQVTGFSVMDDIRYGLLTTEREDIYVRVKEGSTIGFSHGIFLRSGSLVAKQATLAFGEAVDGDVKVGSEAFLRTESGDVHFEDCRVECHFIDMISVFSEAYTEGKIPVGIGFVADDISMKRTRLVVSATACKTPLYALLWARGGVEITANSTVQAVAEEGVCYADAFVHAEDHVKIVDSNVTVSGVGCAFALPEADMEIRDHSEIVISAGQGMYVGGECLVTGESYVELATSGFCIAVVGEDTSFRADKDTKFHLTSAAVATTTRAYPWDTLPAAGFYSDMAEVAFKNAKVTIHRPLGILCRSYYEKLSFTGRYDIVSEVAFFALSNRKENVSFGTEIKGDATLFSIPAFGQYATSLVAPEGVFELSGKPGAMGSLADVKLAFTGYLGECHIDAENFPAALLIAPGILLLAVTVAIIVLYKTGHLVAGHRRKHEDQSETVADTASVTTQNHSEASSADAPHEERGDTPHADD